MTRLDELREQIPTLRYSAYFDYASQGPIPDAVLASMFNAQEHLHRVGPSSYESRAWAEALSEKAVNALADTIGARPNCIYFSSSVLAAITSIVRAQRWAAGSHILVSAAETRAIRASISSLASRLNLGTSLWESDRLSPNALPETIEKATLSGTRLIVLSHVAASTGETMPVREIANRCRGRASGDEVQLLVNADQSFGAIPFDVEQLDADYVVFPFHKWCCGPEGLAAFYARDPESLALAPEMACSRINDSNLEDGWPSISTFAGVSEVLALHDQTAPAAERYRRLQENVDTVRQSLRTMAARTGLVELLTPENAGSGIVAFRLCSGEHESLARYLETRGVLVRLIAVPECLRVCVHYFTASTEIQLLIQAMDEYLRRLRT